MQIMYRGDGSKEKETPYLEGQRHGIEIEYLDSKWRVVAKWRETPYVEGKKYMACRLGTTGMDPEERSNPI